MFDYVNGIISEIQPNAVIIDLQGLGFRVLMPNPYALASAVGQQQKIYVEQIIREDAHFLYGFLSQEERSVFQALLQVSGIGPKSALAIMAYDDLTGLLAALKAEDVKYLTKFPGVGKKTAQQMILDLSGKLEQLSYQEVAPVDIDPIMEETKAALLALGYSEKESTKVLKKLEKECFADVNSCLSQALKVMMGA